MNNIDKERESKSYEKYIGAKMVLTYWKGDKIIDKSRKRVRYDDTSTGEGNYNAMHEKILYGVEYTDGTTEQLADNIITENILSKAYSEDHHYQV